MQIATSFIENLLFGTKICGHWKHDIELKMRVRVGEGQNDNRNDVHSEFQTLRNPYPHPHPLFETRISRFPVTESIKMCRLDRAG